MGDPSYITEMNKLIGQLNEFKIYNPHTNEIYSNIMKDFRNTTKDIRLSRGLDDVDALLTLSELSDKEKRERKRQNEINQYYQKRYQRQIVVLQKIVLFFCLAILGTLFPDGIRPLYLGLLFAGGFIMIFYDLWDIFLRDSRDFDQYNFNLFYNKPPSQEKSYLNIDFELKDTKYC